MCFWALIPSLVRLRTLGRETLGLNYCLHSTFHYAPYHHLKNTSQPYSCAESGKSSISKILRILPSNRHCCSPAEAKPYALVRNTFALLSLTLIIWRAVSAFSGAQDGFETHIVSRECSLPRQNLTNIQVILVSTLPLARSTNYH